MSNVNSESRIMYQKIIAVTIIVVAVVLFIRIFVKKLKHGNECHKNGVSKFNPCNSCGYNNCPFMKKKRK